MPYAFGSDAFAPVSTNTLPSAISGYDTGPFSVVDQRAAGGKAGGVEPKVTRPECA